MIYAIGLLSEEEKREAKRAKRALDALTEATGGQSYYPKELAEVDRIAAPGGARHPQSVHHRVHADQYRLDGSFRQIKVAVVNGPGNPQAHAHRLLRHARFGQRKIQ